MWRHLSITVVSLKTVVQRVRSNRWRFNFERARTGGQINFLWKTAMIITNTKTSKLIICPFPRGLLLTYPISLPLLKGTIAETFSPVCPKEMVSLLSRKRPQTIGGRRGIDWIEARHQEILNILTQLRQSGKIRQKFCNFFWLWTKALWGSWNSATGVTHHKVSLLWLF